jgi:hypothetical protein
MLPGNTSASITQIPSGEFSQNGWAARKIRVDKGLTLENK